MSKLEISDEPRVHHLELPSQYCNAYTMQYDVC